MWDLLYNKKNVPLWEMSVENIVDNSRRLFPERDVLKADWQASDELGMGVHHIPVCAFRRSVCSWVWCKHSMNVSLFFIESYNEEYYFTCEYGLSQNKRRVFLRCSACDELYVYTELLKVIWIFMRFTYNYGIVCIYFSN